MITLTPAYSRDYKSIKAVKESIAKNEDWILIDMFGSHSADNGRYVSPSDLKGQKVQVRYDQLRKVTIIQL